MSTFRNILIANHYSDALTFEVVAEAGKDVFNLYFFGGSTTVFWGDGASSIVGSTQVSHTYAPGIYTARMYLGSGVNSICSVASKVNIRSSNENWGRYPELRNLIFYECPNAELMLTTLPNSGMNNTSFSRCESAMLPIREIPPSAVSIRGFASYNINAILPFTELPITIMGDANAAFYNCKSAVFTITRLPEGITSLRQSFQFCEKANIKLDKLPPGITDLFCAFERCSLLEMNLDNVADNAPAGGFQNLTDISAAFYRCAGVTGSRSRFLALCPNAVPDSYTFAGTNTTE